MKNAYLIIAGKTKGFDYKDGYFVRIDDYANIKPTIESLKHSGYRAFVITHIVGVTQ